VARATFINNNGLEMILKYAEAHFKDVAEKSLYAGAAVYADQIKENLIGILSPNATGKLVESFGITPIRQDREFNYNVNIGFDGYQEPGYGRFATTGVPFQLIARSFESGAKPWRDPSPFAKPAIKAKKKEAQDTMARIAEEEFQKIIKRK